MTRRGFFARTLPFSTGHDSASIKKADRSAERQPFLPSAPASFLRPFSLTNANTHPFRCALTRIHDYPSPSLCSWGFSCPTASSLADQTLQSIVHTSMRLPLEALNLPILLGTRRVAAPALLC